MYSGVSSTSHPLAKKTLKGFQGSISGRSVRHQEGKLYLACRGEEVFNIEILFPVSSLVMQTDYPIIEKSMRIILLMTSKRR